MCGAWARSGFWTKRVDRLHGRIGPEPLEETFTPFVFADRLKGTRTAVKKRSWISGDSPVWETSTPNEALFDARLNPARATNRLSLDEFARLHAAIVDVLQRALASSARRCAIIAQGPGRGAASNSKLRVYGRGGEKCMNCGRKLVETHKIDLRQTVFCRDARSRRLSGWAV